MKAYSRSAGKVIDVAGNQGTVPSGGTDASSYMQEILKQALLQDLVTTGGKKGSAIDRVLARYTPSASQLKATEERKADVGETEVKLSDLQRAMGLLQDKGIKTGPWSGKVLSAKTKFGGANESEREAYNILNRIMAEELFRIGGKVLPAQEIARLRPFLPDLNLPTEQNVTNLEELQKRLMPAYQRMTNNYNYTMPGPTGGQPTLDQLDAIYGSQ